LERGVVAGKPSAVSVQPSAKKVMPEALEYGSAEQAGVSIPLKAES
jgi:hypothetical protein